MFWVLRARARYSASVGTGSNNRARNAGRTATTPAAWLLPASASSADSIRASKMPNPSRSITSRWISGLSPRRSCTWPERTSVPSRNSPIRAIPSLVRADRDPNVERLGPAERRRERRRVPRKSLRERGPRSPPDGSRSRCRARSGRCAPGRKPCRGRRTAAPRGDRRLGQERLRASQGQCQVGGTVRWTRGRRRVRLRVGVGARQVRSCRPRARSPSRCH